MEGGANLGSVSAHARCPPLECSPTYCAPLPQAPVAAVKRVQARVRPLRNICARHRATS